MARPLPSPWEYRRGPADVCIHKVLALTSVKSISPNSPGIGSWLLCPRGSAYPFFTFTWAQVRRRSEVFDVHVARHEWRWGLRFFFFLGDKWIERHLASSGPAPMVCKFFRPARPTIRCGFPRPPNQNMTWLLVDHNQGHRRWSWVGAQEQQRALG